MSGMGRSIAAEEQSPSFLDSEMVLLLQLSRENKDVLEATFKTSVTNQLKKSTWGKIADKWCYFHTFSNFNFVVCLCRPLDSKKCENGCHLKKELF